MNYTQNYQLPQWEKTDRIMMDDFNDMVEKIEDGLSAKNGVVVGSYIGTRSTSLDINLGFRPKAVFVFPEEGIKANKNYVYGGLAIDGQDCMSENKSAITITDTGFRVYYQATTYGFIETNNTDRHIYIAIW